MNISVIGVSWTLAVIFVFYLLFPFFCFLLENKKRAWLVFICAVIYNFMCSTYFFDESHIADRAAVNFSARTNILYCACLLYTSLHELRAADHAVNVLIGTLPLPELGFHHADGRLCRGTVNALAFHAVHEMAAEALLTVLVSVRIVQHVVRADQLVVMCRKDDLAIPSGLPAPLHDFQDDGRCQLVVEVVQVTGCLLYTS